MRRSFVPVVLLTLVMMLAWGGVASAATYTNPDECYTCHGPSGAGAVSKVDFDVPTVDYAKCTACHSGYPGAGHYHFGYSIGFCANCHDDEAAFEFVPPPGATAVAGYRAPTIYGTYATTTSLSTSSADLHAIHTSEGWVETTFGMWGGTCSRCHATAACSACHVEPITHGGHAVSEYPAVELRQATGAAVSTTPSTCVNSACHTLSASGTTAFTPTCESCHPVQADPHGYGTVDHVAADDSLDGTACSTCHSLELATVHGDPGAAGASCATCHPMPRDTFGAWDQSCATGGCHTAGSTAPMHAGADAAHAVASTNALCLDCHPGTDLGSIHAEAVDVETGKTSCFVCHTGVTGEPATSDCTTCHFPFAEHYGAERHTSSWAPLAACGGSGCHDINGDLATIHEEHRTTAEGPFGCDGCHGVFSAAGPIERGETACDACHAGITQTSGHQSMHAANPPLTPAAYAYDVDGGTGVPVNDCIGCHASNLVDEHMGAVDQYGTISRLARFSIAGVALSCDSCHASTDPIVIAAINANNTACTGCHRVHEQTTVAHTSTFVTDPQVDCAACHSSHLETEHNGSYATTTDNGTVLTGCAVCHDYWTTEGPRGVTVQAAIEGDDQVLCTACHSATHPDLGSHTVSGAASQECAGCHDAGGTTAIDVQAIHAGSSLGACAVCHNNSPRVGDLSTMTAECSSCHEGHGDLSVAHTTTSSQGCIECHGSADVRTVHGESTYGECDVCHKANVREPGRIDWATATQECGSCHAYEPVEAQHYPTAAHTAVHADVCVNCHQMDLKAEHAKAGVTCVECHTDPQDKAIIAAGWNGNCDQCHLDSHADKPARHTSTRTDCSTSGCHESDVAVIHDGLSQLGCSTCHTGPTQLSSDLKKDCTTSGCHSAYHKDLPGLHTASASASCTRCHTAAMADGSQLEPLHNDACVTCHNTTIDTSTKTAECTTCHNGTVSPFHLELTGAHTYGGMDAGCQQSGCHLKTLPEEHAKYLSRYPQYADTCALCHLNAALDVSTKTADCSTCHEIHGDIAAVHTAAASKACVDCHESADVRALHGASPDASCNVCHNAPAGRIDWATATIECTSCHGTLSPADPNHYPLVAHAATTETGCVQCHSVDMKTEHSKTTVAVTCVACHEQKVDAFTAPWDKTCTVCHPTKHGNQAIAHKSTNTACTGTGCHVVTDVSVLHGTNCAACHAAGVTASTNCTLCHTGSNPHHVTIPLKATTDSGWRTMCGSCHGRTHSMSGCSRCHSASKLHSESRHTDTNTRCAGCHKVATADATKNCLVCHADIRSGSDGGSWGGSDGGSWGGWRP